MRIFKEEPKKRFNSEELISQLFKGIDEFEKEVSRLKHKVKFKPKVKYKIEFDVSFEKKDFKLWEKAANELNKIFIPYFSVRKEAGIQEIPFNISYKTNEKKTLSISIESPSAKSFYHCKRNIGIEVSGLLLPEELSWNVENKLKITFIFNDKEKVIYDSSVPETNRFSAFDMGSDEDKKRVREHYSQPIVQEVIRNFCKDRYVRIKWAKGCEKPKMRMWEKYGEKLLKSPEKPEDFENYVENYNMIQIYTSVDRREENFPSIFVIESDIGDMLKIINLQEAHALSFDIISSISKFLEKYGIQNYIHLSGNRSFHIWTSGLEKPIESYEKILDSMKIEDEKLRDPYGNLRILGKAIAVHVIRKDKKNLRKKFTIERENVWSRNYRILIDVLSSKKCAVGCPLSLHASSGLAYTRPFGKGLHEYFKEYENYKNWCEPGFAASYAEEDPQIYSEVVPPVKRENFEKLTEDLKKEIVLVLHTSIKDPNVTPDYSLFISDKQADKICRKYNI